MSPWRVPSLSHSVRVNLSRGDFSLEDELYSREGQGLPQQGAVLVEPLAQSLSVSGAVPHLESDNPEPQEFVIPSLSPGKLRRKSVTYELGETHFTSKAVPETAPGSLSSQCCSKDLNKILENTRSRTASERVVHRANLQG